MLYGLCNSSRFFKEGDNRDAIHSAMLESTVDYIMKKNILASEKDRMSSKLKCITGLNVLPKGCESNFNNLIKLLQTSPLIKNKNGGRGTTGKYSFDNLCMKCA